jgi:hypothetical protein
VSRDQNADQNREIKLGNRSFENVSQFKYLGTTATNQNLIQEEVKRRLNSGNACYHSVQNLLSSRLLSKNVKVRMYKTIILPVGRLRRRWMDNIKMKLFRDRIECCGLDWSGSG